MAARCLAWLLLVVLLVACLAGCGDSSSPSSGASSPTGGSAKQPAASSSSGASSPTTGSATQPAAANSALAAVDDLPVKGRAPKTGYSRDQFGSGWVDVDRNGCDTRNDILERDLRGKTHKPGTHGCVVTAGVLDDPYTATAIHFERGGRAEVDIDHVVALGDAWQKGAQQWPYAKRVAFANDPLNLLAVDSGANRQKGDGDAATWLPPNRSYRCAYIARQVAVKSKFAVTVTLAERDAMRRVLQTCPTRQLPPPGPFPVIASNTGPAPPQAANTTPPSSKGAVPIFKNCSEARAAGVTPIDRGTPLYKANSKLDRDKDGVACE